MNILKKKYIIKVPDYVTILYCNNSHILIIKSLKRQVVFNLNIRIKLLNINKSNILFIMKERHNCVHINKKKFKSYRGTIVNLIKNLILDVSLIEYEKLTLVGVGYKVSNINLGKLKIIKLNLGYSHSIFFKVPTNLKIICLNSNKVFIIGSSLNLRSKIASIIRNYKSPDPYKGKGILYYNEKVILKEGKRL